MNTDSHMRFVIAIAMLILCALVPRNSSAQASGLPNQLSDQEFWRTITDLSEPSGPYTGDNWISNEASIQQVIPPLRQLTKPGGVYLGVGPEQNFTYMWALQSKIGFIIDIRRQNMLFASPGSPGGVPVTYTDLMTATDKNGQSWSYLSSEAAYQYVRELDRKNLIIPLVGDFAGRTTIRKVSDYLKQRNATVAAFYISNVEMYLSGQTMKNFHANVATLPIDSRARDAIIHELAELL